MHERVLREDARDAAGIECVIALPCAAGGDGLEQRHMRAFADRHGGNRHAFTTALRGELLVARARRLAVGEDDHVLHARFRPQQRLAGELKRWLQIRAATRGHGGDLAGHGVG